MELEVLVTRGLKVFRSTHLPRLEGRGPDGRSR